MEASEHELTGLVFNIQRFSIQDGPGIRTTVFMKGCPLRCPWCSNPEGISSAPEIMPSERKCIACKKCLEACAPGAISFRGDIREIDWALCSGCLACAEVCPSRALEVVGEYRTVEETFRIAERDRDFYESSGGGVTVSGGEALLQWEFVRELLKKCQEAGLHTALDTTGYCEWEDMRQVLHHTDLLLFDVKHTDPGRHREKTGVPNDRILRNLERAAGMTRVWLRVPIVPGFNDSEPDMRSTAELAVRVGAEKVSLLPCHDWAREKYRRLGRRFESDAEMGVTEPNGQTVSRWQEILGSHGLAVGVGN
ncbi:MAG: glycyl-radical enzyme activating protein [Deltaproteobacteria bacterium]|nr:glycyl-radical enzyme activating protein [Deltaproteobacteria bacterium]